MGSESEPPSTPKLPLLSTIPPYSPEHSGMLTPPLQTSASVPFRWEEEPGKPLPCTALIPLPNPNSKSYGIDKCLELPPRMLFMESKMTKTPSPTNVLDGPYSLGKARISSSFRFSRVREGSFESLDSFGNMSPERGGGQQLGSNVLDAKKGQTGKRIFSSLKSIKVGKKEAGGGSFVFPSSVDVAGCGADDDGASSAKVKTGGMRRNGSFSSLYQTRPRFWVAIYEGFKQVMPWKSRKSKKEELIV
ncbi:hypothetical protein RJ639_012851 [Escallonia herrerae]|uniref:Uncharacterized protein n=1 Tax=Escallonia herrerae TaxID=1293975 RepID=A0AA88VR87_9ASTE|nr:hypothetical protein RJ639_012851 [Escallonia herrerae]